MVLKLAARRLIAVIPILLIISLGVFSLLKLVPGNIAQTLAGQDGTPEEIAAIERQLHLNEPFWQQYLRWLGGALRFNFGDSLATGQSISQSLASRFPVTFELVVAAGLFALVLGVPIGILAGLQPGGRFDAVARLFASVACAIPAFWLAPMLLIVFAVERQWLPPSGFVGVTTSPIEFLRHALLPAVTLGLFVGAALMRQIRSALIDVLDSNYVRTMWAKGAKAHVVVLKHAFRNAAIPAVTIFGLEIGMVLGGSVIIEQIFGIQGLGMYVLNALNYRDVPVIQAVTMVFALTSIGMSLLVDIVYALLNPKVRVQ